jgi:hypothetical protein
MLQQKTGRFLAGFLISGAGWDVKRVYNSL